MFGGSCEAALDKRHNVHLKLTIGFHLLSCMSAASWLAAARSLTAWLADFGNHRANAWLGVELH